MTCSRCGCPHCGYPDGRYVTHLCTAVEANEPRGCPTPGACSAVAKIATLEAALNKAAGELEHIRTMLGYLVGQV